MSESVKKSVNIWKSYEQKRDGFVHFLRLLTECFGQACNVHETTTLRLVTLCQIFIDLKKIRSQHSQRLWVLWLISVVARVRMQVLVQPLKSLGGTRRVWRKILYSWLLALVFAVPQLLIFVQKQERRESPGRTHDIIAHESILSRSIHVRTIWAKCSHLRHFSTERVKYLYAVVKPERQSEDNK